MQQTNVLDHFPRIIAEIEEIKTLAETENDELNLLYKTLETLMNDQFVHTATEIGISKWEKQLGIVPAQQSTLDSRRWEILNRLNIKLPYTVKMLHDRFYSMFGDNYSLKVIGDTFTLKVRIPDAESLGSTLTMLEVIVPVNMIIDLGVL